MNNRLHGIGRGNWSSCRRRRRVGCWISRRIRGGHGDQGVEGAWDRNEHVSVKPVCAEASGGVVDGGRSGDEGDGGDAGGAWAGREVSRGDAGGGAAEVVRAGAGFKRASSFTSAAYNFCASSGLFEWVGTRQASAWRSQRGGGIRIPCNFTCCSSAATFRASSSCW